MSKEVLRTSISKFSHAIYRTIVNKKVKLKKQRCTDKLIFSIPFKHTNKEFRLTFVRFNNLIKKYMLKLLYDMSK